MITHTSPSVTIRDGAIGQLETLLTRLDAKRVFFVFDKAACQFSGAMETLTKCFDNRDVTGFSEFELNPKIEDVEKGIALFRKQNPDVIIALGGGSALDMAKLIGNCSVQNEPPLDYITGAHMLHQDGPPLIAIPTTAGTGSEATHFAVVYVDGYKYSLANQNLLPEYVLIDPKLTYSLPPRVSAAGGLDALCQAIESVWAAGSTEESMGYALEALQLALDNLEDAVNKPTPDIRMKMATAAHLAGKAINISKTTAPHAFSYAVTTRFGVPHGIAVALTSGAFLNYNYLVEELDCTDPRGAAQVKWRIDRILHLLGDGSIEMALTRLENILLNIQCPVRLRQVGIQKDDLPFLVSQVNLERLSNNPRKIDSKAMLTMLETLL